MRKIIFLAVFCLILSAISFAQVPQKMSYQAVVRGSDNNLVTNQQVAMRVSILHGSVDGTAVYTETHSATTNANGLLTIEIGDGTSNDDFTAINWANGPFFVKTETDVNGGDDYDIIGVSQLLSVPYAMYAQTAGNMPDVSVFLTEEADPTIPDWAKAETKPQYDYSEIQNTPEIPERQVISISNDTIFLSDGGFVKLPPAAVGFSGDYNDLTNRPAIPTVPTNVSAFTNDANYLTSYTESDPTVPDWAKAANKPTYTYEEIENTPDLFDGNYNSLTNRPELFSGSYEDLTNKPELFDGNYNNLTNTPDLSGYLTTESDPTVPAWAKATDKPTYTYEEIENTPDLFDGNYNSLTNKPELFSGSYEDLTNKPELFDGNYNNLTNTPDLSGYLTTETDPTVPTWAKTETKPTYSYEEITGKPELFSGNYNDLTNKPAIPTVPTNVSEFTNDANYVVNETDPTIPDWAKANAKPTYSYDEITGKPELFSGNYNDLTNKPTIPTVPTSVSAFENDANYITLAEIPAESQTLADVAALGNSMNNTQIKNVATPTEDKDAATKKYVDDLIVELLAQNAALQSAIEALPSIGMANGHAWVDLGLPSGTRWATCNVGANSPEEYGDYFAWGETEPKGTYNWSTYRYYDGSNVTKYTGSDNLAFLEASDDAATANWGEDWRMPTKEEFEELNSNCTVTWTTQNGVNGRLFTGPNGNSIFLPAAGYRNVSSLYYVGSRGDYWSSSLYTDYPYCAWALYFDSDGFNLDYYYRCRGLSVRPVCAQ